MVELPEDVLIQIFQQLTHSCFIHPTPAAHPSSWFRTAQVCRYWRNIVISAPSLWSHIEWTQNSDWVRLCISKSKDLQTPLWISLDLRNHYLLADSKLISARDVFALLPRAYHFTLGGTANANILPSSNCTEAEATEQVDAISAPQLQSVKLVHCRRLTNFQPFLSFLSLSHFPSLTRLQAVSCNIRIVESFLRPTITHLSIQGGRTQKSLASHSAIQVSQLVNQLAETTPALQEFVLEDFAFSGFPPYLPPSIQLPNTLKHIRLSLPGWTIQTRVFLEQLSVPPSVHFFELNLHKLEVGGGDLRHITDWRRIANWLRGDGGFFPRSPSSVGIALELGGERCVIKVCRGGGVDGTGNDGDGDGDGNRGDEDRMSWWTVSFEDQREAYLDIIPCDRVTSLELKASPGQVKSRLPLLRKMAGIRTLRYIVDDEGSIERIFQLFPEGEEMHDNTLIFPCLSHLEFFFPHSDISPHDNTDERQKGLRRQLVDRLSQSIRRRIDRGTVYPVDTNHLVRVSFRGCPGSELGLGEEELLWLREAFPKLQVKWDTTSLSTSAASRSTRGFLATN